MLASCTDTDLVVDNVAQQGENEASNAVQFGTYMGKQDTRAYEGTYAGGSITNGGEGGTTGIKTVGFGVFAYNSAYETFKAFSGWDLTADPKAESTEVPNFMYNEKITWNSELNGGSGAWEYSPVKYWPNGTDAANAANDPSNTATEKGAQYLSFFAYAPYTSIEGNGYVAGTDGDFPTDPIVEKAKKTGNDNGIVAVSTNDDAHDIQVKYAFKSAADENSAVDLLWGLRGQKTYQETDASNNTVATLGEDYNVDLTKQTVGEKVKFLFKHALARVGGSTSSTSAAGTEQICGLKVVVDVDTNSDEPGEGKSNQETGDNNSTKTYFSSDFNKAKTLVTIKEVKIRDQHTYSQEPGSTISETKSDFATEGWFDIMRGEWTKSEVKNTTTNGITYSITANSDEGVDNTAPYALNDAIKEGVVSNSTGADWITSNSGGATGVETTAKNVFANENVPGLLLIPGGMNGNTLYITVDYFVRTADAKLSTGYSQSEQIITNKVTLTSDILKPNKYYTIVMHLGLTSVKFEAVVADWSGKTNGSYDEEGKETPDGTDNEASIWLPSNVIESSATATTVTAGKNKEVAVPAETKKYEITLTGYTDPLTVAGSTKHVYTDKDCTSEATDADATVEGGKVTVTFDDENKSSKNKTYYVKVTDATTPTKNTSIITITQKAAAITVTPSYSLDKDGGKLTNAAQTITLNIKDANSDDLDLTSSGNKSTILVTPDESVTITPTNTGATIVLPANSEAERKFSISVKVNDAPAYIFEETQAAGE